MITIFDRIGRTFIRLFEQTGLWFDALWRTFTWSIRRPFDFAEWFRQMVRVGVDSIPVVFLTTMFTGMVLGLQTFSGFQRVHAEQFVASVVSLAMLRELSPVLCGLMVAGRVGSSMAAEIGTMRVTEQLDALKALATEPIQYLFVPRVIAGIVMLPFLVILGDALGIYGGYIVAVKLLKTNPVVYKQNTFQFLQLSDVWSGLIKAAVFGLILTLTGCVRGYYTTGGAEGVGRATTYAVVSASLIILFADFFLTKILFLMAIIELRNIDKSFGGRQVLRDMSIEVEQGESLVIVGGSGTGKSVTLKHIIGLLRPDRGQVIIDGHDITTMKDVELNQFRRRFGMSFQEGALFDSMSVFENIAFPLRRHTKMTEAEIRARVEECLEDVHLHGVEKKRPSELSGGMRRRVGFARAISLKPEILLFDEPTTGLDPVISDVIADLIEEMDVKLGTTTVTITHDMKVAFKIADRVAMLYKGHIIEQGTPEKFQDSSNPIVRQFIEGRAEGPLTDGEEEDVTTERRFQARAPS